MGALRKTLALLPRWLRLVRGRPVAGAPRPFYGQVRMPGRQDVVGGGLVKFQRLAQAIPDTASGFNVLYLGSNTLPPDWRPLLALARRRGIPLVWNQDGVAYPGWHGPGWERVNEPMRRGLHEARHVFFQSAFCKVGADRFLGERQGSWEVLHNAVDTGFFVPAADPPTRPLTLLLGGNQYQRYRLETALRTLALLPDARLLVSGTLSWGSGAPAEGVRLAGELGVRDRVEWLRSYRRSEAPAIYARADVLLHTKYNDPCPTTVVEALACGLPVAYSGSGGVPELVGDEAGVGVPAPLDWERDHPPAPEALAEAVTTIRDRLEERRAAARDRAVARFDLAPWVERHRAVFAEVVAR
jgi:glycosyltransferase involved in cell wall biosynthesis